MEEQPLGWFSNEDAEIVLRYAEKTEGPIVEIGSFQGRSTVRLGTLGRKIHCVDTWQDHEGHSGDESFAAFKKNTEGLNLRPYRMRVEDWEPVEAEFVFLDGDHSYEGTLHQIIKALRCKPKFIAVHDYVPDTQPVMDACKMLGHPIDRRDRVGIWKI